MATPKSPSKPATPFTEFLELRFRVESDTAKMNNVFATVERLKSEAAAARDRFYASLLGTDFLAWCKARAALAETDPCTSELASQFSGLAYRAAGNGATKRIVGACLGEMRMAIEKQMEQFRSASAELAVRILGTESASDHPALAQLQSEAVRLQDAVDRIENSDDDGADAWSDHHGRIVEWIEKNEPSLLGK